MVGTVRLGVIGTTARWLVPHCSKRCGVSTPRCVWSCSTPPSSALVLETTTGTVDLAVVNLPIDHPDIEVEMLFTEDRILIVPRRPPPA